MIRNAFREDGSWALVILLIPFVAAASLYNLSTPLYESPDELQHAAYAAWLADGRGLPVVDPAAPGPWRQEGTQPPLYYLLPSIPMRVSATRSGQTTKTAYFTMWSGSAGHSHQMCGLFTWREASRR